MKLNNLLPWGAMLVVTIIHAVWVRYTVKWTSPYWYFISFTILLWMILFLIKRRRGYKVWWRIVIGLVAGFVCSTLSWFIADLIYAPHRMDILARTSPLEIIRIGFLSACVTGSVFVATIELILVDFLNKNFR